MATGSAGVGRCDPHLRDSRLMSSVEKYHGQTWDAWTDMRTPEIREEGIAMGTQKPGLGTDGLGCSLLAEVTWSKGGVHEWETRPSRVSGGQRAKCIRRQEMIRMMNIITATRAYHMPGIV